MTRGYIVITEGRTIIDAVYSPSSSYMGCLGVELIKHLKSGSIEAYVTEEKECFRDHAKAAEGICPEWYRETKNTDTDGVQEYGYEYNRRRDELKVYNYGKLVCTINPDSADFWLYVAEHEDELYYAFLYDESKLSINFDLKKLYRIAREKSIQELEDAVKHVQGKTFFILRDHHIMDVWYSIKEPAYVKPLEVCRLGQTARRVNFYVRKLSEYANEWEATIQLPYIRVPLHFNKKFNQKLQSETAAVNAIRDLVREQGPMLESFTDACSIWDEYTALAGQAADAPASIVELDETLVGLKQMFRKQMKKLWDETPWFTAYGYFNPDKIEKEFNWRCQHYKQTYEKGGKTA